MREKVLTFESVPKNVNYSFRNNSYRFEFIYDRELLTAGRYYGTWTAFDIEIDRILNVNAGSTYTFIGQFDESRNDGSYKSRLGKTFDGIFKEISIEYRKFDVPRKEEILKKNLLEKILEKLFPSPKYCLGLLSQTGRESFFSIKDYGCFWSLYYSIQPDIDSIIGEICRLECNSDYIDESEIISAYLHRDFLTNRLCAAIKNEKLSEQIFQKCREKGVYMYHTPGLDLTDDDSYISRIPSHTIYGSSAEFVGPFWFRKIAKGLI
ncbi:MAG: hypothetical protein Q8O04_12570 [Deltaproteobacteria bacterium]|nr:hypothetical protein [Deltaproteobacteria bacterium]